jgi:Flp pilus assembly pilin Flp
VVFASEGVDDDGNEIKILTSEEKTEKWINNALDSFDPSNRQYSTYLNEESGTPKKLRLEDLCRLAHNAQSDITKILEINRIIRDFINEETGASTLEVALLLLASVAAVLIFRSQILSLINSIFKSIRDQVEEF